MMHIPNGNHSNLPGYSPAAPVKLQRRDYAAERLFRTIKNVTYKAKALATFKRRHPNYKPEPFYSSTSYMNRKGYEALVGQRSTKLSDNCGKIGRLRVVAGAPLWWKRISFRNLPSVAVFHDDPDAQFSQQVIDWVIEDLLGIISGPFVAVIERGWYGGNHVHVFHLRGACSFGRSRLIPDYKLSEKAAYIYKKPYWNDENALAYLTSADLNGKVPRRVFARGLGNGRTKVITAGDVESAMNMPLLKKLQLLKRALPLNVKRLVAGYSKTNLLNLNT